MLAAVHMCSARKSAESPPNPKSARTKGQNADGLEVMLSGSLTRAQYRNPESQDAGPV